MPIAHVCGIEFLTKVSDEPERNIWKCYFNFIKILIEGCDSESTKKKKNQKLFFLYSAENTPMRIALHR